MSNQPRLLSQFYLKIGGQQPVDKLLNSITELTVESSLHLPDVATITLLDPETLWADSDDLVPGKAIVVTAQTEGSEQPLFDGEIVEVELAWEHGLQQVIVRAFDRLHRLARGRQVRSFQNMTDGDLISKIAQEVGLQAQTGPTSQVHTYMLQANETNLAFLQGRAAALGYLLYVTGKVLHCKAPQAQQPPVVLAWGREVNEFRPRLTTIGQVSQVTARGWDPVAHREIVGQSKASTIAPQIGNGKSGGTLAEEAFDMAAISYLVADRPVRAQPVAERLAQAVADRQASAFIEAEGSSAGNPSLIAGAQVQIDNIGTRFSGTYFVTSATHTFRPGEYMTRFSVSGLQPATLLTLLAPAGESNVAAGLVIGLVTDNQDPDGLGRVKVKFPWLSSEHASAWGRIVAVGGGPDRGVAFFPEVNDEVLVGFEQGDINYPYVLGGLWNGQDKPPKKNGELIVAGKVQQRIICSRSGHTITLDDSDSSAGITIEDKKGNKIVLDSNSNALKITTPGNLTLEAKGQIEIKGMGVKIDGGAAPVDIKGMGAKLDGGAATVDVKGTIINLN